MEQSMKEILNKITEISTVQDKILKKQQEMKKEQQNMREELTKVGNTVTRIEYEHGRKIDIILEVLTGHTEKLEENEKQHEKEQKIIEMYGHKIYALEQQKEK